MSNWLVAIDKKMENERKKVRHFMEDATPYPIDMKLSNVKLVFFATTTTSNLQLLDLIIINILSYHTENVIIPHGDSAENSAHLPKSVNLLQTGHWISTTINFTSKYYVKDCSKRFVLAFKIMYNGLW